MEMTGSAIHRNCRMRPTDDCTLDRQSNERTLIGSDRFSIYCTSADEAASDIHGSDRNRKAGKTRLTAADRSAADPSIVTPEFLRRLRRDRPQ